MQLTEGMKIAVADAYGPGKTGYGILGKPCREYHNKGKWHVQLEGWSAWQWMTVDADRILDYNTNKPLLNGPDYINFENLGKVRKDEKE